MGNFIDKETKEEFWVTNFQFSIRNGKTVYLEKGKPIKNPKTGNLLDLIELPPEKRGIGTILKSNDKATLQKMLAKRSHQHFKKEVEEVKRDMNKKLNND